MAFSSHRMNDIRSKFARLDRNGDGKLAFPEAQEFYRNQHIGASNDELKQDFEAADLNNDGFLNFHEFLSMEQSKVGSHGLKAHQSIMDTLVRTHSQSCSPIADDNSSSDQHEEEYAIHDGESFEHFMQRVEDEHPSRHGRRSPFRHTATQILELEKELQQRQELPAIATANAPTVNQLRRPKSRRASEPLPRRQARGPERFFYDERTYTGTQAYRGNLDSTHSKAKRLVHNVQVQKKTLDDILGNFRRPSPLDKSKGPERLFYDTSSYTGVSKHGGRKFLPQL